MVMHFIANRPCGCRAWMVKAREVTQVRYKPYATTEITYFFKCHCFWQFGIYWKLLIVNINMAHEKYAKCEFSVYVSTDATADAASCSTFAAFIFITEERKSKIWMHINHCLSSTKAIRIQEVQKLLCVNAAASDAKNLRMWCLASLVDIFSEILIQNLWNNCARLKQFTKQRSNNKRTAEKEFFIHIIEICWNSEMFVKSYRYWLLKWQP